MGKWKKVEREGRRRKIGGENYIFWLSRLTFFAFKPRKSGSRKRQRDSFGQQKGERDVRKKTEKGRSQKNEEDEREREEAKESFGARKGETV